jgi:F0F1-type ATP synthase delta subunit
MFGEISVSYHIDDAIIGGIIIFDGEKIYDGSIRTQLNNIKEKIN